MKESDLLTPVLTAFFTVLVFTIGQIIEKLFILPIQKQKNIIGKIVFAHTYYANVISFKDSKGRSQKDLRVEKAVDELRILASDLVATENIIPLYNILTFLKIVLPHDKLNDLSASLIGWSNSIYDTTHRDINRHRNEIGKLLNIRYF